MRVRHRAGGGFTEDFTRSDRSLSGDNGWTVLGTGATAAIVSNRFRMTAVGNGFPGSSSGNWGGGISRTVIPSNSDVVDLAFDVVVGAGDTTGAFYAVLAGHVTAGALDKGILIRCDSTAANWLTLMKFTSNTNAGSALNPASNPSFVGTTTRVRAVLVRSTGVVTLYQGGALLLTTSAGYGTGFTDNTIFVGSGGGAGPYNGTTNKTEFDNIAVA